MQRYLTIQVHEIDNHFDSSILQLDELVLDVSNVERLQMLISCIIQVAPLESRATGDHWWSWDESRIVISNEGSIP